MVLKKIDNRIRVVIENGVQEKHRSMFFVVGDKARDQVCTMCTNFCGSSYSSFLILLFFICFFVFVLFFMFPCQTYLRSVLNSFLPFFKISNFGSPLEPKLCYCNAKLWLYKLSKLKKKVYFLYLCLLFVRLLSSIICFRRRKWKRDHQYYGVTRKN